MKQRDQGDGEEVACLRRHFWRVCPSSEGTPSVLRTPRYKTTQNCLFFYTVENG